MNRRHFIKNTKYRRFILYVVLSLFYTTIIQVVEAQKPLKHLYLGNDTHTDLIWNGDEEFWYKINLDMAKFYLNLGEGTRDKEPAERSKWNYDVAWTLYMMEKHESPEFFNRVIEQIKNEQASVPFNFTLPVYGASTLESILRSFYYSGHLERKYGLDIDLAICQENATIPLGLASLWAGSGAKYSWRGVCNCATKTITNVPRDQQIYWYTGLDDSKILMKWYSNYGWNAELGGYAEMLEPTIAVLQMDTLCGSKNYPYHIAGAFGKGWDNMYNYSYDLVWGVGHRTRPGTKVFLSDQIDFFRDFEQTYGVGLPALTETYGNEWDLNLVSLAEVSGQLRRSMEKLRSAESLAALATAGDPQLLRPMAALREDFLYGVGMYNLHGWTADGPINRHDFATYMRKQQQKVTLYTDSLFDFASEKMAAKISNTGQPNVFYVYNPLNWERNGLVSIPLSGDFNAVKDLKTGKIKHGTVLIEDSRKSLKVEIGNLPSVGYKLVQLVKTEKQEVEIPFNFEGNALETPFYKVKLSNSGSILSLYDKQQKKEWCKSALNQLDGDTGLGSPVKVLEEDEAHMVLEFNSDEPLRRKSWITFYSTSDRIDIHNQLLENFGQTLHWSFNFNVDNPDVWHEETGAVIKARLVSEGGHYADKLARYDYLTLNHFVNVGNKSENITLSSADCLFFKLGNSAPQFLDQNSSEIHVLIGGQVNDNLGVIEQDGDSVFNQHFSILPQQSAFDTGSSMRFALEHQNPPVAGNTSRNGIWKEKSKSFFKNSNPDVILWTLKPGEEDGITLRLWNLTGAPVTEIPQLAFPLSKVKSASHVETEIAEIPIKNNGFQAELNKHQLKTFRIWSK